MKETQQSICAWTEETFGPAPSQARIAARANEEMAELLRLVTSNAYDPHEAAEEAADVVIVLYRLAHVCGVDLHAAIDRKMAINRQRKWAVTDDGHGYHVKVSA